MELVFQDSKLDYLGKILCDTVVQEQTADIIIPDSLPDADRVVDAFGTPLIRSEECSSGSASVNGMVQVGVLFVSEQGQVQQVQTQIPFSVRRDFAAEDGCTMHCCCTLRSVDARPLNSRKLLVRVGIACTLSVFAKKQCTCHDISEPAPNLQLKRMELPLKMPLGLGEKRFVLNEELEVPTNKAAVASILKCLYRPQLTEQRVVGNKAVFKGKLTVHVLYEGEDGKLAPYEWSVPFSQYAELEREMDDADLQTTVSLTSAETEPDSIVDCRRLLTSVNLMVQCVACGVQKLSVIEDAYCTDAVLTPQFEQLALVGQLDCQTLRETVSAEADQPASSVVDAWMYPEEPVLSRNGDAMELTLPLGCNVLYYDADGALQGRTLRPTAKMALELSENGSCTVTEVLPEEIFCAAGNGITLRVPVNVTVESHAEHCLKTVCGGEIAPLPAEEDGRKPSVILRRSDGEELWDIAKSLRTSVKAIAEANDLQEDYAPENTLLLIPL